MIDNQLTRSRMEILLVEDNPGDVRLTLEALKEGKLPNHVRVAQDGVEALKCLHREDPYGSTPSPDLILLDLDLPGKSGNQNRSGTQKDSGRDSDLLPRRTGHYGVLRPLRELLHCEALRFRPVRQRRPIHPGLLVHGRQTALTKEMSVPHGNG